ncbi:hypothetical protein NDU88_006187 [Pleurodeles waltl]|uniref:Uncharacterized protein n=1 Tax=Pleurodeles waltl TaxID=8319 RepID=A0AAV7TX33_PLEWA|nr:hypothetical protein NDU88_006187 [Pleurodeles waltl]
MRRRGESRRLSALNERKGGRGSAAASREGPLQRPSPSAQYLSPAAGPRLLTPGPVSPGLPGSLLLLMQFSGAPPPPAAWLRVRPGSLFFFPPAIQRGLVSVSRSAYASGTGHVLLEA